MYVCVCVWLNVCRCVGNHKNLKLNMPTVNCFNTFFTDDVGDDVAVAADVAGIGGRYADEVCVFRLVSMTINERKEKDILGKFMILRIYMARRFRHHSRHIKA